MQQCCDGGTTTRGSFKENACGVQIRPEEIHPKLKAKSKKNGRHLAADMTLQCFRSKGQTRRFLISRLPPKHALLVVVRMPRELKSAGFLYSFCIYCEPYHADPHPQM